MKRAMTMAVLASAGAVAVLARCAGGGVVTIGDGIVSDSVLEMLLCRPLANCGAKKGTAPAATASSTRQS